MKAVKWIIPGVLMFIISGLFVYSKMLKIEVEKQKAMAQEWYEMFSVLSDTSKVLEQTKSYILEIEELQKELQRKDSIINILEKE